MELKMTKQEKIKEAWAGFYNPQVKESGWMDINAKTYSNDKFFDRLQFNDKRHSIRPKSLQGIEDNNGWIKIDNDLCFPKSDVDCWFIHEGKIIKGKYEKQWFSCNHGVFGRKCISHYKIIDQPQPPIY